jgi:hypothetical protein
MHVGEGFIILVSVKSRRLVDHELHQYLFCFNPALIVILIRLEGNAMGYKNYSNCEYVSLSNLSQLLDKSMHDQRQTAMVDRKDHPDSIGIGCDPFTVDYAGYGYQPPIQFSRQIFSDGQGVAGAAKIIDFSIQNVSL